MVTVAPGGSVLSPLEILIAFLPILLVILFLVLVAAIAVILCVVLLRKKNKSAAFNTSAEFPHKTVIYIDGMSCEHCSSRVQAAFVEKGYKVRVNLEQKNAEILSKTPINQAEASTTIQDLGFTPVQIVVIQ